MCLDTGEAIKDGLVDTELLESYAASISVAPWDKQVEWSAEGRGGRLEVWSMGASLPGSKRRRVGNRFGEATQCVGPNAAVGPNGRREGRLDDTAGSVEPMVCSSKPRRQRAEGWANLILGCSGEGRMGVGSGKCGFGDTGGFGRLRRSLGR